MFTKSRTPRLILLLAMTAVLFSGWSSIWAAPQSKSKNRPAQPRPQSEGADWPAYGRASGGSRYSPLKEINRENVKNLKAVWTYRTGDVADGSRTAETSQFEATPIMVEGMLYLSTPFNRVIALDPETGAERWSFDPRIDLSVPYAEGLTSRGVSTWLNRMRAAGEACRRRIFVATNDGRLIAPAAPPGKTCADFGKNGPVDR